MMVQLAESDVYEGRKIPEAFWKYFHRMEKLKFSAKRDLGLYGNILHSLAGSAFLITIVSIKGLSATRTQSQIKVFSPFQMLNISGRLC